MRLVVRLQPRYTQTQLNMAIETALHEQAYRNGLDGDLDQIAKEAKVTSKELCVAWKRYIHCFGGPPKGTQKQLEALLELVPARVRK